MSSSRFADAHPDHDRIVLAQRRVSSGN